MFASYVFPDKNQNPLGMSHMQTTKQAVAILSLISGNVIIWKHNLILATGDVNNILYVVK